MTMQPGWKGERFRWSWLGLLAIGLTAIFAGYQLSTWPARLRYPGELMDVEGMRLAEMQHLRRGVPIYAPASEERFDAAIYGPIYYLFGSRLVDPDRPTYLPLRLLSMLAILGCAACAGLLAFWLSRRLLAAVLAPLIFLAYGTVTNHGLSARSDAVALLLSFGAFLLAFRFQDSRRVLLSTPLMLLGIFYKPQFLAGPGAVLLFLLVERRWRRAGEFAGLLMLGGLAMIVLFQFKIFAGQAFIQHLVLYNLIPFSRGRFLGAALLVPFMFLVPLLVSWDYLRKHPSRLFSGYLACAGLLVVLTVAKEGSDGNYFLEFILSLSVLFAASLSQAISGKGESAELLILLAITLFLGQWFTRPAPSPEDFDRDRAVQHYLRRSFQPGTPAFGHYTGDLVRAGLETPVSDIYQYSQLIRKGTIKDRDWITSIERRTFGVIILTFDLEAGNDETCLKRYLTDRVARSIVENYQPIASLDLPGPEKFHADDRFYAWTPRLQPLIKEPALEDGKPKVSSSPDNFKPHE